MPVKSESKTVSRKRSVIQGKWGKSFNPPTGKNKPAQQKGDDTIYLGKSIAPPNGKAVQKKDAPKASSSTTLPDKVQQKMEHSFGTSFSDVKIHTNSVQAKALGAQAFTQGSDVHFAPGKYEPNSQKGQELIGHELTHVEQQRAGKVAPTAQAKGMPINDDPSLEQEADLKGAKAAKGEQIHGSQASAQLKRASNMPVQRSIWESIKSGAKKVGGAIASGAKKVGGAIASGAEKVGSAVKKVGGKIVDGAKSAYKWAKENSDFIAWVAKAGKTVYEIFKFIKNKEWTAAFAEQKKLDAAKNPPGKFGAIAAKAGMIVGLITGSIQLVKSILKIVKGVQNKKAIKETKEATTSDEKTAKETLGDIQNIRISFGAINATDAILSIASSIMTIAGVATVGIGAIIGTAITVIQLVISGGKAIYNLYKNNSETYKAKVKAQNEATAEGMLSLKDAKLFNMIGMGYDPASGKVEKDKKEDPGEGIKNKVRFKLSEIKKTLTGEAPEKEEVDQSKQKQEIIDHLNKEREDASE